MYYTIDACTLQNTVANGPENVRIEHRAHQNSSYLPRLAISR